MPRGYILALVEVPDLDAYRDSGYMAFAEEAVAVAGGRFMVRRGEPEALEGAPSGRRIVILEFPTRAAAAAFYHGALYAPAIRLRQSLSSAQFTLLSEFEP